MVWIGTIHVFLLPRERFPSNGTRLRSRRVSVSSGSSFAAGASITHRDETKTESTNGLHKSFKEYGYVQSMKMPMSE